MNVVRRITRVGGAYYIALPKPFMSELGLFRGAPVVVRREGTRFVIETDPEEVKKSWEVPLCKQS